MESRAKLEAALAAMSEADRASVSMFMYRWADGPFKTARGTGFRMSAQAAGALLAAFGPALAVKPMADARFSEVRWDLDCAEGKEAYAAVLATQAGPWLDPRTLDDLLASVAERVDRTCPASAVASPGFLSAFAEAARRFRAENATRPFLEFGPGEAAFLRWFAGSDGDMVPSPGTIELALSASGRTTLSVFAPSATLAMLARYVHDGEDIPDLPELAGCAVPEMVKATNGQNYLSGHMGELEDARTAYLLRGKRDAAAVVAGSCFLRPGNPTALRFAAAATTFWGYVEYLYVAWACYGLGIDVPEFDGKPDAAYAAAGDRLPWRLQWSPRGCRIGVSNAMSDPGTWMADMCRDMQSGVVGDADTEAAHGKAMAAAVLVFALVPRSALADTCGNVASNLMESTEAGAFPLERADPPASAPTSLPRIATDDLASEWFTLVLGDSGARVTLDGLRSLPGLPADKLRGMMYMASDRHAGGNPPLARLLAQDVVKILGASYIKFNTIPQRVNPVKGDPLDRHSDTEVVAAIVPGRVSEHTASPDGYWRFTGICPGSALDVSASPCLTDWEKAMFGEPNRVLAPPPAGSHASDVTFLLNLDPRTTTADQRGWIMEEIRRAVTYRLVYHVKNASAGPDPDGTFRPGVGVASLLGCLGIPDGETDARYPAAKAEVPYVEKVIGMTRWSSNMPQALDDIAACMATDQSHRLVVRIEIPDRITRLARAIFRRKRADYPPVSEALADAVGKLLPQEPAVSMDPKTYFASADCTPQQEAEAILRHQLSFCKGCRGRAFGFTKLYKDTAADMAGRASGTLADLRLPVLGKVKVLPTGVAFPSSWT